MLLLNKSTNFSSLLFYVFVSYYISLFIVRKSVFVLLAKYVIAYAYVRMCVCMYVFFTAYVYISLYEILKICFLSTTLVEGVDCFADTAM